MNTTSTNNTTPAPRAHLVNLLVDALRIARQLHAELADVRADRDVYREIAREGMHALADLTKRHKQTTERYHALLNEARALRAQIREAA